MSDTSSTGEPELRTERLRLVPLSNAYAGIYDGADCYSAQQHWAAHGFGPWAVLESETFIGVAEIQYAHPGIVGITTGEIEAGWTIVPSRRGDGLATEAMRAAFADAWSRAMTDHIVAYIRPENAASHRVAAKLGFSARGEGLTRSGDPMTVYELRKGV